MSADSPALVRTFRVGKRTVTMTVPNRPPGAVTCMSCEWSPGLPNRPLTKRELREYRAGRHAVMVELAEILGGAIAVVET